MADNKNIKKISTVADFLRWARENRGHGKRAMLYRGLASADWEVESRSYRCLRDSISRKNLQENLLQYLFADANKRLLQTVRMEKCCAASSDLELLAKLQHDGVATCLIDFTAQPLVALWFACQPSPDRNKPGKVVVTDRKQYTPITPEDIKEKKIWDFLEYENEKPTLWVWEQLGKNNDRIIAQHSVFIFGVPEILINENDSCIIEEENKEKILKELQDEGISAESLFPDHAGFILYNKHDEVYENWPIDNSFYSGLMNQQIGAYDQAIRCYNQAIKFFPEDANAYNNRGLAKSVLGRNEEAIADYDEAINLDSEYASAYNNRGNAKSALGRNEEAIADYDEAIRHDSKNADAHYNRGVVKNVLGRNEEAILDFNKVIDLAPKDAQTYGNRGNAKYNLGCYEEAILDYDKAIDLALKDAQTYGNRGNAKYNLRRYEEAILDYDKAIDLAFEPFDIYYNRCLSKIKVGDDIERALEDYWEAKKLAPDDKRIVTLKKLKKYYLKSIEDKQIKGRQISLFGLGRREDGEFKILECRMRNG